MNDDLNKGLFDLFFSSMANYQKRTNALLESINSRLGGSSVVTETTKPDLPYSSISINLTSDHAGYQITTVRPFDYIQVYCDGVYDGLSLTIGSQSAQAIDLKQMTTIPVGNNPTYIYLTNDVRTGRSRLTLYFVRSQALAISQGGQDISLSELAARNGSIQRYDKRGDVVFCDSFEDSYISKWLPGITAAMAGRGAAVVIDSSYARSGSSCLKMTTGSQIADYALLQKYVPHVGTQRYGLEASLVLNDDVTVELLMSQGIVSGGYNAGLRLTLKTAVTSWYLQVMTGLNTWTTVATVYPMYNSGSFNTVKFVVDFNTKKYVRVMFADETWDISSYGIYTPAVVTTPRHIFVGLEVDALAAANDDIYIDDVILTSSEP